MRGFFPAALQLADSLFPSGGFTLSHGLETLVADGLVRNADDLEVSLGVHVRERMAMSDLPALMAAHRGAAEAGLATVVEADRLLAAVRLVGEEREASARVGLRVAVEAARLVPSDPGLARYVDHVRTRTAPGSPAVALGLAGAAFGVPVDETAMVACHTFASAYVSAAMRLLRLGHGDAQAVLWRSHPAMRAAVERAAGMDWRELGPTSPQLEIAAARHEGADARRFAS